MIAAVVLAADIAATLDLSDRSEAHVRATQQTPAPATSLPAVGFDLSTQPEAHLHVYDRRWDLTVGYSAAVLAPDLELGFAPLVLQTGSVGVAWRARRLRLMLLEEAGYGLQNSAFLSATALPTVQPTGPSVTPLATAAPSTVLYGSTRTAAGVSYDTGGGTLLVGAEFFVTGGLDAASQATLPEQVGERATVVFQRKVSRWDTLVTDGFVQHVDFSQTQCVAPPGVAIDPTLICQPSDELAQVVERVRHTLSRTETVTLGVGSAVSAIKEQVGASYHYAYYPVADASYVLLLRLEREGKGVGQLDGKVGQQLTREGKLALSARLAPYIDPRTGVVLNALQGDVTYAEQLTLPLTLTVLAGASQNLPAGDPAAASIVRGEVSLEYRLGPQLAVSAGERAFWESENGLGNFVTALGYVAVTVREPTLHF